MTSESVLDCALSYPQCLGHLEDTLQSLVEGGNASALPYSPPAQSYGTLFDGDAWDSFGTELPSVIQPETNRDAHNYSQRPDNNIPPSVIAPAHQESSPNSIISDSHIYHTTDQTAVNSKAEEKDTLYEIYILRFIMHNQVNREADCTYILSISNPPSRCSERTDSATSYLQI